MAEELMHIVDDSATSAEHQAACTERLAAQNREVSAPNKGTPKGSPTAFMPLYKGYTQAEWDEWHRSRSSRFSQAEWDAWSRSCRY